MKIKFIILLAVVSINISCEKQRSSKSIETSTTYSKSDKAKEIIVENPFYGCWVVNEYVEKLESSKSPKQSQEKGELICLPKKTFQNTMIVHSFHEGSDVLTVVKRNENFELWKYSDSILVNKVSDIKPISKNKILINSKLFIRVADSVIESNVLYHMLFTGVYSNTLGGKVEFRSDGKIVGLDTINTYKPRIDYYDAGSQIDLLGLGKSENDIVEYGFKYSNNKLDIYSTKCLEWDDENKFCLTIDYDSLFLELIKEMPNNR